jgi:hypothetical protein
MSNLQYLVACSSTFGTVMDVKQQPGLVDPWF